MKIPQKPPGWKKILEDIPTDTLKKILNDEKIRDFVNKYSMRHIHWDELRYRNIPNNTKPEFIWVIMKVFRDQNYKTLILGNIEFKYLLTDETQRKLHNIDKCAAGNIETDFGKIDTEGKEKYIINSLMEEAIASSQLEGAATTRRIAKEILMKNKKSLNYDEEMIINGYKTIRKIVKMKKDEPMTPELVLDLQEGITRGTFEDCKECAGKFRDSNDIIIADNQSDRVLYKPPDYKQVPELIEEFCKFANDDESVFIHPIIKGIILHFLIGYIHPFNDGNGRTARAIFYWYVLTRGYWLFEFMPISRILLRSKANYTRSYLHTETDENDLTYFINYNLSAIEEARGEMEDYIRRKQKEREEAKELWDKKEGINLRRADILKRFMKNPEKYFVINEIMNTYGVAYETARSDLLHLTELDYLEKKLIKKKFVFRLKNKELLEN